MTIEQATQRFRRLRSQYLHGVVGSAFFSAHHDDPTLRVAAELLPAGGRFEVTRRDGSNYVASIDWAREDHDPRVATRESMTAWGDIVALTVGQKLAELDYLDRRPLFEFARHVRNAVAHNHRFDIRTNRPMRPAQFDGIEIHPHHNNKPLNDVVWGGDILAMLDAVINALESYTERDVDQ